MKRDVRQSQVSLDKVRCIISSIKPTTLLNKVHHILLRNGRNDFTGCRLCNAQCDKYTQQHTQSAHIMQIGNVNVNLCVHMSKSKQLCSIKLHIFYTHPNTLMCLSCLLRRPRIYKKTILTFRQCLYYNQRFVWLSYAHWCSLCDIIWCTVNLRVVCALIWMQWNWLASCKQLATASLTFFFFLVSMSNRVYTSHATFCLVVHGNKNTNFLPISPEVWR